MYKLTFGKHKGKTLEEVRRESPSYFLFIKNNFKTIPPEIKQYIEENLADLRKESRQERYEFLYDYCDGEASIEY